MDSEACSRCGDWCFIWRSQHWSFIREAAVLTRFVLSPPLSGSISCAEQSCVDAVWESGAVHLVRYFLAAVDFELDALSEALLAVRDVAVKCATTGTSLNM